MNLSDVFISYAREDQEFVEKLNQALMSRKNEVWVDWQSLKEGQDWWQSIEEGIQGTNTFVFVISPASVQSVTCYKEVQYALSQNKRIIPILFQALGKYENQLHPALQKLNWINFVVESFDESVERLIKALERDIEHVRAHTRYQLRAIEWQENDKSKDLLLSGTVLAEADTWLKNCKNKEPQPTKLQHEFISASLAVQGGLEQLVSSQAIRIILSILITSFTVWLYIVSTESSFSLFFPWMLMFILLLSLMMLVSQNIHRIQNFYLRVIGVMLIQIFLACCAYTIIRPFVWQNFSNNELQSLNIWSYPGQLQAILFAATGLAVGMSMGHWLKLRGWQSILIALIFIFIPILLTNYGYSDLPKWFDTTIFRINFSPLLPYTLGISMTLLWAIATYIKPLARDIDDFRTWLRGD